MKNLSKICVESLEKLLYSSTPEELEKVATDPKTPAQILNTIYFERLWPVDEVAKKYNRTPRSIQSTHKKAEVNQDAGVVYSIQKFFKNPNIPEEVLINCFEEAVSDGNLNMMIILLEHPNFPPEQLEEFATGNFERYQDFLEQPNKYNPRDLFMGDFNVYKSMFDKDLKKLLVYAAANNPNLSPDILLKLANESQDEMLLRIVAKNPNLSREGFDVLFQKEKIEEPQNPWERKKELLIIDGMSENPSIPEDLVRAIYTADKSLGYKLLHTPNVPSDIIKDIYENMTRGDIFTRHALATQKNIPEDILLELYNDEEFRKNIYHNESFLKNPSVPPFMLAEMLNEVMPTKEDFFYNAESKCQTIEGILAHPNFPYAEGFPKDVTPEMLLKTPALKYIILGKLKNPNVPESEKERILVQHGIINQEENITTRTSEPGQMSFEVEALLAYFSGTELLKETKKRGPIVIDADVVEAPLLTNDEIKALQQRVASLETENEGLKKEIADLKKMFPQIFGGKPKTGQNLDDSDDGLR